MTSRQRSSSALSSQAEQQARTPSPGQLRDQQATRRPDLVLDDVPISKTGNPGPSLAIPSHGTGSPYPSISATPASPSRPRASTTDLLSGSLPRAQRGYARNQIPLEYQQGQRYPSTPLTMEARQGYIPPPPPPMQQQSNPGMSLPPPPPRPPITNTQANSNVPPPPPGPPPSATTIPSQWSQQGWGRQQPYIPPPPPLGPNQVGNKQNQYANQPMFQNQRPGQLPMPPPPPLVSDVPNVSATYIPGGESFGPGVGIPPLYTQQEQEPALARDDSFSYSHFEAGMLQDQKFFNGSSSAISPGKELPSFSEHVSGSVPQTPHGKMNHIPSSAIPQSAVQSSGQPRQYYVEAPDNQITHGRSSSAGLLSPSDPARDWPLERVLKWLEVNGFSTEWQETFGSLNIHGKDFLDLGGANNVRGTIGMMHEKVYPRLARVCAMSTGWNQDRETREGRRLKKEVRKVAESTDSKSHGRRESGNMAPSASTDGGVETSPNPSTNDALSVTPSTAGGGDDSPGRHFRSPVPGINSRMGSKTRSSTAPTAVYNHGHASASESLLADVNQGNRAGVTRGILNNINDAMSKRHHSPSASSETGTGSTFIGDALRNAYDASPQSGSPSSQHAMLPPSSGPGALSAPPHGRAAHRKTGSTDSVASRRNGQEAHRPTILDIAGRHNSHDTPSSAKELSKGFLERFRKRRKDQDSNHVSPEDHHPDSPTSPQHHRVMPPSLPFMKGQMNNSSTSLERPSSASTEHDRFLRERGIFQESSLSSRPTSGTTALSTLQSQTMLRA